MKTFFVQTLGCKVNHYESEQIATLLQSHGLTPTDSKSADLRIVNTCSVTMQAASQSRQSVRRIVKLPVLGNSAASTAVDTIASVDPTVAGHSTGDFVRPRVIVTGCWATSNTDEANAMAGVDAVLSHHQDVALELERLLAQWKLQDTRAGDHEPTVPGVEKVVRKDIGWEVEAATPPGEYASDIQPKPTATVNEKLGRSAAFGTTALPLLGQRQPGRQRAFLKIQDGCDAHCTYCIIPTLRPSLWSKPIESAIDEARALVAAGHVEIVLTGIFLGAYGQPTALRRRQPQSTARPLGQLVDALCTSVPGLRRLRLSSLEPGDLTDELIGVLQSHPQVVPHFHLPLQSGSDLLLRRMNRQYGRDDFLRMVDRVREAFDRPAFTTDVVAGFPGEDDAEFEQTADLVRRAGFIHVHAFPYSPRPGTAAARWTNQFVRGPVVNERIDILRALAAEQSYAFRRSFLGEEVELIIERDAIEANQNSLNRSLRHGRCERYFAVLVDDETLEPGDSVRVKVAEVTREETIAVVAKGARVVKCSRGDMVTKVIKPKAQI